LVVVIGNLLIEVFINFMDEFGWCL